MHTQKSTINSLQFGLFSPTTIKSLSVLQIIHPETFENGIPKDSGLADPRMGTSDFSLLCSTCNKNSQECQGHFGHIELCKPVFHIGYLAKIKKVLECVCFYCSSIKTSDAGIQNNNTEAQTNADVEVQNNRDISDYAKRKQLNLVWAVNKTKNICQFCSNKQPVIRKEGMNLIAFMKGTDVDGKILLSPEKVYAIFKRISDVDISRLGFDTVHSRPEFMILTTLIVSPPCSRPSIQMDGLRGEDDLTHKYADIIKANINLKKYEQEGAPTHILRDYEQLLQFHVATLIDNDISGQPQALQKSGRPLKSLSARLKGKEGRLRYNLMGKRVDFSARTVITPDPNISLVEVGVPVEIAMIHTINETVNALNIEKLQHLVSVGPNVHPGANYVIRTDGQRIDLRFNRSDIILQNNYVVERHLDNGDIVLFNRQPSLHKMSMMAHRVKVMTKKTIRLNLSVTTPYNADFDGDEMNLHAPQNLLCISELENLAFVNTQIVSPQSNKPVMGIVQDTLVGVRKLTGDSVFVSRREAMQIFYSFSNRNYSDRQIKLLNNSTNENNITEDDNSINNLSEFPAPTILRPKKLYTGKQIFSWSLPPINLTTQSTDEKTVHIVDGILHSGVIDKKSVGTSEGGIIHIIFNDFGREICTSFFDSLQKIVMTYITTVSTFSIGIGDTIASRELKREIDRSIKEAHDEVNSLINDPSVLTRLPGMTLRETFESKINVALNKARNVSGSCAQKYLSYCNNVKQMVLAGSKGSLINISQMTACVGQQNVEGKRIPFGFRNRTLPHFAKDDYGPKSRGFVENSYLTGLTPEEFYFHAMGGREGLIDTAVKTAETGYIQRRLVKAMEDLKIEYDTSVRSSHGVVTQFVYGDDGYKGESIEKVYNLASSIDQYKSIIQNHKNANTDSTTKDISYANYNKIEDNSLGKDAELNDESHENKHQVMIGEYTLKLKYANDDVRNSINDYHYEILYEIDSINNPSYYLPINIPRIFKNILRHYTSNLVDITPKDLYRKRKELEDFILNTISPHRKMADYMATRIVKYIRQNFSMINILLFNLNTIQLNIIINIIKDKFCNSLAVTNEMVGTLSAQSVGEPATQMTLNTFHYAGVASTVTLGVPRLKEIINVAKTLKTPSMRIELKKPYSDSLNNAKSIQMEIEYTCVKDILDSIQLIYDPEATDTVIEEDKDFVGLYFLCPDEEIKDLSPYVLRFVINREKMISRGLSFSEIIIQLKSYGFGHIITSDENSEKLIIRLRTGRMEEEDNMILLKRITEMTLNGFKNIKKVFLVENKNQYILQTEGVNLRDLLSYDKIKNETLYSNNILEIFEVLGIEAAREATLRELRSVIENEGYVNYRHLSLLSDVMTMKGILTGITRHGVNKGNKSALMRCSFEETVEILLEAALIAEKSKCKEVTESIILGQVVPIGTGCTDVYLDCSMLKDAVPVAQRMVFDFEKGEFGTPFMKSPISDSSCETVMGGWSPIMGFKSPGLGITTPGPFTAKSPSFSPTSPSYSPTSPSYSPTSPSYSPTSPSYSPTSPSYSPTSPSYSPTSPSYSPTSPSYSPTSPSYNPTSPSYSPINPRYNITSPSYNSKIASYSPTSPSYTPGSPSYFNKEEDKVPKTPGYKIMSPSYHPVKKEEKKDK